MVRPLWGDWLQILLLEKWAVVIMRNWLKTLLFASAFSPALLTLAYARYDAQGWDALVMQFLIVGAIGCAIPPLIVLMLARMGESIPFQAKKIESNDFMLLAFVGSYLVPLISRASEMKFGYAVIVTIVLVAILWTTSDIPSHPLIRLLRFRFYKVESSSGAVYVLLSKRAIHDPKSIVAVKKISESMMMEVQ